MNRKISIGGAAVIMLLGVLITFQITMTSMEKKYSEKLAQITENQVDYQKISTIDQTVRRLYVKNIDEKSLENELITGYFKGLGDKYSYYMTPDEYAEFQTSNKGKLVGIGVKVHYDIENDAMAVYSIVPGSPAAENGLLIGDLIVAVGDENVSDIGYFNAVNRVKGEIGTICKLTIIRGEKLNEKHTLEIPRAEIEQQYVTSKMLDNKIAYVSISEFSKNTASQFISEMDALIADGAVSVIFDVRGNPGGDLESVRSILDYLLPEGPIIRMYTREGKETILQSDAKCINIPTVTLINLATASAAELFAAALKDYKMTTLIGERTFGKGSVQSTITLPDHSGIVLSTELYSPPKSDSIDGIGVTPDLEIKLPDNLYEKIYFLSIDEDTQLKSAIDFLSQK